MTNDQISRLWRFARRDSDPGFEQWLYQQEGLEDALGKDFAFRLMSCDFRDREQVWKMSHELAEKLDGYRECECPKIRDLDLIPMGEDDRMIEDDQTDTDFWFEKIFENLEKDASFGEDKWWLSMSSCRKCATTWMIAQDDHIYDDFLFKRIGRDTLHAALAGDWPDDFLTYEKVLAACRQLGNPPRFADPMAGSLLFTVEDLLAARPDISNDEIAHLLGLSSDHAETLVAKVQSSTQTTPHHNHRR